MRNTPKAAQNPPPSLHTFINGTLYNLYRRNSIVASAFVWSDTTARYFRFSLLLVSMIWPGCVSSSEVAMIGSSGLTCHVRPGIALSLTPIQMSAETVSEATAYSNAWQMQFFGGQSQCSRNREWCRPDFLFRCHNESPRKRRKGRRITSLYVPLNLPYPQCVENRYRMTPGVRHSGIVNWLIYLFIYYIDMNTMIGFWGRCWRCMSVEFWGDWMESILWYFLLYVIYKYVYKKKSM